MQADLKDCLNAARAQSYLFMEKINKVVPYVAKKKKKKHTCKTLHCKNTEMTSVGHWQGKFIEAQLNVAFIQQNAQRMAPNLQLESPRNILWFAKLCIIITCNENWQMDGQQQCAWSQLCIYFTCDVTNFRTIVKVPNTHSIKTLMYTWLRRSGALPLLIPEKKNVLHQRNE